VIDAPEINFRTKFGNLVIDSFLTLFERGVEFTERSAGQFIALERTIQPVHFGDALFALKFKNARLLLLGGDLSIVLVKEGANVVVGVSVVK